MSRMQGSNGQGDQQEPHGVCRNIFEGIMIESGDPRVERWMQRVADEMEEIKEREGGLGGQSRGLSAFGQRLADSLNLKTR